MSTSLVEETSMTYGNGVVTKGDMDVKAGHDVGMKWIIITLSSRASHYLGTVVTHGILQ